MISMFRQRLKQRNKIMVDIFRWMSLMVFSVVLVSLVTLSFFFINIVSSVLNETIQVNVEQSKSSVELLNEYASLLSRLIYFDRDVSRLMNHQSNTQEKVAAFSRLTYYRSQSKHIHSVYIYSRRQNQLYVSAPMFQYAEYLPADFQDQDIFSHIDEATYDFRPIRRIIFPDNPKYVGGKTVYSYIFNGSMIANNDNSSCIVLNISTEWFDERLSILSRETGGKMLIIDNDRNIIAKNFSEKDTLNMSSEFITRIIRSEKAKDTFVLDIEGERTLVTYARDAEYKWTFVQLTSYASVLEKTNYPVFQATLIVCVCVTFGGWALSLFVSRRLQRPIEALHEKLAQATVESAKRRYGVQCDFMRELLSQGSQDTEEIARRFADLELPFSPQEPMTLALLRINRFSVYQKITPFREIMADGLTVVNISEELIRARFDNGFAVSLDERTTLIALNHRSDNPVPLLRDIQHLLEQRLPFSVSAAYILQEPPCKWNEAYAGLLQAMERRYHLGDNALIDANQNNRQQDQRTYPEALEKELLSATFSGNLMGMTDGFGRFCSELADGSVDFCRQSFTTLCYAIKRAAHGGDVYLKGTERILRTLQSDDFFSDTSQSLFGLLSEIAFSENQLRIQHVKEIAEQVLIYLRAHYAEDGLYLEQVASDFGYSSGYLNRVTGQHYMKTIPELLLDIRMEKAQALLSGTDLAVSAVATQTGFASSSYFSKVYKKYYGRSPTEMREGSRFEDAPEGDA